MTRRSNLNNLIFELFLEEIIISFEKVLNSKDSFDLLKTCGDLFIVYIFLTVGKLITEKLKPNFFRIGFIRVSRNKEIISILKLFNVICIKLCDVVFRGGFEPPTKRFSVFYSTIELPKQKEKVPFFPRIEEEDLVL